MSYGDRSAPRKRAIRGDTMGDSAESKRATLGGKRKLCVGRGERCFACGGRGSKGPVLRRSIGRLPPARVCPVCGGRGRAIVVDSGDRRTGLFGRPS
jgi:DnaJ-class molecular chaperone